MRINLPVEKKKELEYRVGDIIVLQSGNPYFIVKLPNTGEYALLKQDMRAFASGRFQTIDFLIKDLRRFCSDFKHFSTEEYELALVKKEDVQ
ncbi:hypothetical protein BCP8-2_098 [Bacillus phage BCP8-2]|uniref:Uncharacterized protein n=1 Tax=Bacillus phage BCP8-2 TaxID=1129192 RepID=A0A0E3D9F5_9CAUD|nr:hypothetical protein BCP8-2_098 [Bacillus phage BCP8-2]AHJ87136.1 hypothetical protein BCP8-2_098 [Bacillus phage BCP8-2]